MKQPAICQLCGNEYIKKAGVQKYCPECGIEMRKQQRAKVQTEKRKKQKLTDRYSKQDTLADKCKEIELYNKLHHTHLSYGDYTAMERAGKI